MQTLGGDLADRIFLQVFVLENRLEARHAARHITYHQSLPPLPVFVRSDRRSAANIHVRGLEEQIAFDNQFFNRARTQIAEYQISATAQKIVLRTQRIEGDVGRYHGHRLARALDQNRRRGQPQSLGPKLQVALLAAHDFVQYGLLENLQANGESRGA